MSIGAVLDLLRPDFPDVTISKIRFLEAEGLVISRPGGRYVIQLSEKDVRDLLALRVALESLAIQLAAARSSAENQAQLRARLRDLEEAVADGDPMECTKCDMALHETIWRQADNPHLLRVLSSVLGAIFVLADRVKVYGQENLERMLVGHRKLVEQINAGDAEGAASTFESHMRSSLNHSLRTFQIPQQSPEDL